jgi:hypothetical protein
MKYIPLFVAGLGFGEHRQGQNRPALGQNGSLEELPRPLIINNFSSRIVTEDQDRSKYCRVCMIVDREVCVTSERAMLDRTNRGAAG